MMATWEQAVGEPESGHRLDLDAARRRRAPRVDPAARADHPGIRLRERPMRGRISIGSLVISWEIAW